MHAMSYPIQDLRRTQQAIAFPAGSFGKVVVAVLKSVASIVTCALKASERTDAKNGFRNSVPPKRHKG
jgi:hypothetical protein